MPKRKITIEEAYAAFERHGLQVEVKGIQQHEPIVEQRDLFKQPTKTGFEQHLPSQQRSGREHMRIALRTKQTIAAGGHEVYDAQGKLVRIDGQQILQYGPGYCTVPIALAADLLYQDQLAVKADYELLHAPMRSRVILATPEGASVARHISDEYSFDMSGFLGQLGNSPHAVRLPF